MEVAAPPAFLMEMLELNDELAEARRAGDAVQGGVHGRGDARARARVDGDASPTGLEAGVPAQLEEAAHELVALRYYQRFLEQAEAHAASRGTGETS